MKREKPRQKLTLNRETIKMLSDPELAKVQGAMMKTGETAAGEYGCGSAGCGPGTNLYC